MLARFAKIQYITAHIERKKQELAEYNKLNHVDLSHLVNGRRMTNIGTFRAYVQAYLKNHPQINQEMTFLVRQLAPTSKGLPLEIYVFCKDIVWPTTRRFRPTFSTTSSPLCPPLICGFFRSRQGRTFRRWGSRTRIAMSTENLLYTTVSSSLGELLLAGDRTGLRHIYFESGDFTPPPNWQAVAALPYPVADQLDSYFAGRLRAFDLPLHPKERRFNAKSGPHSWKIPYGETISYLELARRIGNPNSVRAVGLANGRNPLPIVVPCHRVIGSNGSLVGYASGLPIKRALLALEGVLAPQLDLF